MRRAAGLAFASVLAFSACGETSEDRAAEPVSDAGTSPRDGALAIDAASSSDARTPDADRFPCGGYETTGCSWELPRDPQGTPADPDLVAVALVGADGGRELIPRTAECAPEMEG